MDAPAKKSPLAVMLESMVRQARSQPNERQISHLRGGLSIGLVYHAYGGWTMILVRKGSEPASQTEWLTVVNHLPAGIYGQDTPDPYAWQDWKGLRATWAESQR